MKITGKKLKMSQVWHDGKVVPITPIQVVEGDISAFEKGEILKVSGTTKGKGFQGVVKRHGFAGGPKTHGQKHSHRAPGSIGAGGVQRVIKGLKMAGRMGGVRVTMRNLKLVDIQKDTNTLFVKGAVPGNTGGRLEIYKLETAATNEAK